KPGGLVAVTVPRYWPEKICWALSTPYHEVEGGHVRINKASELVGKLEKRGLTTLGTHHAHALHSPYWWLKCAVGVDNDTNLAVKAYHRMLVWDMMKAPALTRQAEKALNPVMGKSFVVYLQKQY
ncbi:MAG: SAM-dependent methyltransferase, partial [Dermacoccus nishinomiyaensis]